jgi:coenzyme F420-0:L-glutamate ligase/coenzyme F420-1:gamma-L-glutamate ligase
VQLIALEGLPLVKKGDGIGELILNTTQKQGLRLEDGDVIVVAQSIVSKVDGNVIDLREVKPGKRVEQIAAQLDKDPRDAEVILLGTKEIVRLKHVLISRTEHGFVCGNAGVDHSNVEPSYVTLLPDDPDASAARILETIKQTLGVEIAVIVGDTQGRPFRCGAIGVPIGVAGMYPLMDWRGKRDLYGKLLKTTVTAIADALAAAAVAVMGESSEGTPVVIVKDVEYQRSVDTGRYLIMPLERDLFR